jgi:hypothetical protein
MPDLWRVFVSEDGKLVYFWHKSGALEWVFLCDEDDPSDEPGEDEECVAGTPTPGGPGT